MNKSNQSEKAKPWWEAQKDSKWKILVRPLTEDPEIHSQINNLITAFYWKFREYKGVPKEIPNSEIDFQGFKKFKDFPLEGKMGHCKFKLSVEYQALDDKKIKGSEIYEAKISITLNQKYLLNRLGMDEFITDYQENEKGVSWSALSISFNELIGTIAHELAHAYQNTIRVNNGEEVKSQCASSGDKENYPELVAEHTALTSEIKSMIENSSEYQSFKEWWNDGDSQNRVKNLQRKENTVSPSSSSPQTIDSCQICQGEIKKNDFFGDVGELKTCRNCWQKEQEAMFWQPWMTYAAIGGGVLVGLIVYVIIKNKRKK